MVARVQLSEREMRMLRSQGAFAFVGALPGPRRLSITDESGTTRRVSVGGSSRFVVRGSEPPLGLDAAGFSLSDYPGRSTDELGFLKPPLGLDDVGKKVWQKAVRLRSNETTGEVWHRKRDFYGFGGWRFVVDMRKTEASHGDIYVWSPEMRPHRRN